MSESGGTMVEIEATDGHALQAYRVAASGARGRRGGVVVIQEIFGVNGHIRGVADRFADAGYAVVAPALFDRVERGVELGYGEDDIAAGLAVMGRCDLALAVLDVEAAIATLGAGVGLVGYCWGGTVSWVGACRASGVAAAVCYYGGQIVQHKALSARCPVLMHFGAADSGIPLADVEAVRAAQPHAEIHVYPAGHGFNCEQRGSYDAPSAALAMERTLAFYDTHL